MGKLSISYACTLPVGRSFASLKKQAGVVFLIVWLIACGHVSGQSLTLKQYLKSGLDDGFYKSFDNQNTFLQNQTNYGLPWVNKLQVLYQDNQFSNYQTRYAFRFYPGNPFQIQSNKRYFQGYQTLKNLEQKLVLKEILRNRYDLAVEFYTNTELLNLLAKQKQLREKIGNTMQQKAGSVNFDPDQFLNAQLDIISKEADWHELILEQNVVQSKILVNSTETRIDFPLTNLIDLDQLNQVIQNQGNTDRTEFNFLKQRVEISNLRAKLEKSNFDIGYLQAVYGSDRRLDGLNTLGLAFGVAIPIINPNKENVAREKLIEIERQGKLSQFQSEEKNKQLNSITNLKLHLDHYQKLDSLVTAVKKRELNLLTGLSNNYDPLIELKYQEKLIQLEILKVRIKGQILLQYISFLDNSDKLHERPLLNYLSKDLERIEP